MNKSPFEGTIFLAGGGDENDSRILDEIFLRSLPRKTILYIPVAMTKTYSYEQCFDWITSSLPSCSETDVWIEMATHLEGLRMNDLEPYDAIYLGGGNTFSLLKTLRQSGFHKLLREFSRMGGCIYGGSAGAIVLGKTIETAKHLDHNDSGLVSLVGLALIKEYSIWPHYQQQEASSVKLFCALNHSKIIAIPEKGGVVLSEGVLRSVGQDSSYLFYDQKEEILDKIVL